MSEAEDKLREDVARMFAPVPVPAPETEPDEEAPEDDEEDGREIPAPAPDVTEQNYFRTRNAVIEIILQRVNPLITTEGIKSLMDDEGVGHDLEDNEVEKIVAGVQETLRENDLNAVLYNLNDIVS